MRKLLSLCLMLISLTCSAQDVIVFHNGTKAEGSVSEVNDMYIKFKYTGENTENTMGRAAIAEVRFASGRIQEMSEKIYVNSVEDWQKVQVVYDKAEVMGLKPMGQVEKHSSGTWSFSTTGGHFAEKTLNKIRKEAAKRGACYVLVTSQQSKSGNMFSDGHASMTGQLYSYE